MSDSEKGVETAPLCLRPATMQDAKHLFEWRNDGDTRKHFKNVGTVAWEDHLAWLRETIVGEAKGRILRIVESENGRRVGVVRSDEKDGLHELSYTIAPAWRGKGVGKRMVLQFVNEVIPNKRLMATIEEGYAPSENIARALGLKPRTKIPPNEHTGITFVEWR